MNISIFGLGNLGAPLAAVLAAKGHKVVGVDLDGDVVARIEAGVAPVSEPGLGDLIKSANDRLTATTDGAAAVRESEATFLLVPTPSEENGAFSLKHVLSAAEVAGRGFAERDGYHLFVVTSTVMPGSTDGPIRETLESASGKRCGVDFGLCYSPEFVALGTVIRDMLAPDFVLIGESDARAGDTLAAIYHSVNENRPSVERMNIVNAEVTKLAVNTFVTTKISFANMLSDICEHLPGADADRVTSAIGQDSRIGRKYIRAATAYGGPCFPRDNRALKRLADSIGATATLAEATDAINRRQIERLYELATRHAPAGGRVAVLGLSYKAGIGIVEQSAGVALARRLAEAGIGVSVYDPAAMANARACLGDSVRFAQDVQDCLDDVDVAIVATPWPEFADLGTANRTRRLVVIDCWRIVDPDLAGASTDIVLVGKGG